MQVLFYYCDSQHSSVGNLSRKSAGSLWLMVFLSDLIRQLGAGATELAKPVLHSLFCGADRLHFLPLRWSPGCCIVFMVLRQMSEGRMWKQHHFLLLLSCLSSRTTCTHCVAYKQVISLPRLWGR